MPELATDCEILWVKVKLQGRRTLLVCCFYHPHAEDANSMKAFTESAHRASNIQDSRLKNLYYPFKNILKTENCL